MADRTKIFNVIHTNYPTFTASFVNNFNTIKTKINGMPLKEIVSATKKSEKGERKEKRSGVGKQRTENRRERPKPRKGREEKRQVMPRCWLPSREALW